MSLLSQVRRLWDGGVIQDVLGAPTFLRDDLPSDATPFSKATQELGRRACRQVARTPSIAYGNQMFWSGMCDPYLDSIDEGPTEQGNYDKPFTGGQCSNVTYVGMANFRVQTGVSGGKRTWAYNPVKQQATPSTSGPINAGPTQTITGSEPPQSSPCYPSPQVIYNRTISAPGIGTNYVWSSRTDNVTFSDAPECQSAPWTAINLEFVRTGGGSDTCGDPPSQYEPPRYPTGLPPLPPPTSDLPGLGDGWDVTINPDGTFNVCVGDECTPDINPDGTGGDPSEDPGEPDGDPKENDPSDPNDDTIEGCAEEGHILTGIKINFTQIPQNVSGPLDYYYRVCYVGFGPDLDLIDLVIDGKLVKDGQFVIPDSEFCKCFRVVVSPGWGLSVQAYSRPEKEE
jgi:hypothetical protein